MDQTHPLAWRKSSHSAAGENCVEAAALPKGDIALRDSKHPGGPTLSIARGEWQTFVTRIKDGTLS